MKQLLLILAFLLTTVNASAQQQVVIKATDPATGATVNVGDSPNNAIKVSTSISVLTGVLHVADTGNGNGTPFAVSGRGTVVITTHCTASCDMTYQGTADGTHWFTMMGVEQNNQGVPIVGQIPFFVGFANYTFPVAGLTSVRAQLFNNTGTTDVTAVAAAPAFTFLPSPYYIANQSLIANGNINTPADFGAGVKTSSTLRAVLATDQTFTTPFTVTFTNQSVNVAQVGGNTTTVGGGTWTTGTQRVILATDQQFTTPRAVTGTFWQATQPVSGTFWQATQPVSGYDFNLTTPSAIPVNAANNTVPISIPGNTVGLPVYVQCVAQTCAATVTDNTVVPSDNNDFMLTGGLFNDGLSDLVTTHEGMARITKQRALHVNLRNASGTEVAPALDATLTNRTEKTQITDGTRDGTVKAASTLPLLTDTALVTTQRDPLPAGTNVIGHIIADTGSTTAVTQATAANLNATVVGTGTFAAQVTGTVTTTPPANASTNVAQFGGTNTSTGTGASGAGIPRVTVSNDSTVGLVAGSAVIGHVIADTGSTTTVTGTVTVAQATGTNLHAVVDSGALTANAGTNLNTSLLALEAGGNLATIVTNTSGLVRASAATTTTVDSAIFETVLLASNASRKSAGLINTSRKTLLIKLGTGIGSTSYSYMVQPGASWNLPAPTYTGVVTGIWVGLDGGALVTEM